jgi:hypothetical protein
MFTAIQPLHIADGVSLVLYELEGVAKGLLDGRFAFEGGFRENGRAIRMDQGCNLMPILRCQRLFIRCQKLLWTR